MDSPTKHKPTIDALAAHSIHSELERAEIDSEGESHSDFDPSFGQRIQSFFFR